MKTGVKTIGQWKEAMALLAGGPAMLKAAIPKAIMQEALHFERVMKKNIGKGVTPIDARSNGSSRPLVKSGDLRNSIHAEMDGPNRAFIGINKSSGKANIAAVHEFGATIVQVMTPKQRRFLFGVLFKGAAKTAAGGGVKGFIFIRIPARPFIRPVFESEGPGAPARFAKRLAALLGGKWTAGGAGGGANTFKPT